MAQPLNVNARETEKFGRLQARWWDPAGPMRSLHAINPLRTSFIAHDLDIRGQKALDVGCGGGLLTESLAQLGAQVTGIDLSEELLSVARSHARHQGLNIDYRNVTAEQLAAQRPAAFDIVTCMEVLEHIPRPREVVQACGRLLRSGGHAFFATLDRSLKSFVFAIVGAEYVLHLLPMRSHTYRSLIRPDELSAWAQSSGLEFVRSAGVTYNLVTRRFGVAPRPDVSYMAHYRKR